MYIVYQTLNLNTRLCWYMVIMQSWISKLCPGIEIHAVSLNWKKRKKILTT